MQKITMAAAALCFGILLSSCASDKVSKGKADAKMPVNCATAEADIRMLNSEKTHASDQLAAGVSSITPAGIVANLAMGTSKENAQVATGDYNKLLDAKIAEIKKTCGVK